MILHYMKVNTTVNKIFFHSRAVIKGGNMYWHLLGMSSLDVPRDQSGKLKMTL